MFITVTAADILNMLKNVSSTSTSINLEDFRLNRIVIHSMRREHRRI